MNYEKVKLPLGSTIEEAVELLLHHRSQGKLASVDFNDITLYSDTVTMDDAYVQIVGKTKTEIDEQEVCSKCGVTVLPIDSPYYHCDSCRKKI